MYNNIKNITRVLIIRHKSIEILTSSSEHIRRQEGIRTHFTLISPEAVWHAALLKHEQTV